MQPEASEAQPVTLARFDDWLVVHKPAGWHSVSQPDSPGVSVEAWLRQHEPVAASLQEAGLVHRLDQFTSGCLAVACSAEAHARLREAFSQSGAGVRKTYLALVAKGLASEGRFRLHFESRYKRSAKVTVGEAGDAWSAGRCLWKVLRRGPGAHDLAQVELIGPGRRHQIRAGLAHLGHALAGDTLYGGSAPAAGEGPALHAWRLELEGHVVEAPPPARFGSVPRA